MDENANENTQKETQEDQSEDKPINIQVNASRSSPSSPKKTTSEPKVPSKKIIGDYLIKETIGKGTFSRVKLGIHMKTGKKVAIKILDKSKIVEKEDLERIIREMEILSEMSHPNIIKVYQIFENPQNYYIIMEYCEGGELFNYIVQKQRLEEDEAALFYYQLINGLEYIHSKGIAHRDLKPENLLLCQNKVIKIIDFGLSNYFDGRTNLVTPCGSPCYASPEMVSGETYDGFMIDIWATGIILFAMLCGYLPFEDDKDDENEDEEDSDDEDESDNEVLFNKIMEAKLDYPEYLSDMAVDLLKKILVTDPKKRITINEIKKHKFYLKGKRVYKRYNQVLESNEFSEKSFLINKLMKEFMEGNNESKKKEKKENVNKDENLNKNENNNENNNKNEIKNENNNENKNEINIEINNKDEIKNEIKNENNNEIKNENNNENKNENNNEKNIKDESKNENKENSNETINIDENKKNTENKNENSIKDENRNEDNDENNKKDEIKHNNENSNQDENNNKNNNEIDKDSSKDIMNNGYMITENNEEIEDNNNKTVKNTEESADNRKDILNKDVDNKNVNKEHTEIKDNKEKENIKQNIEKNKNPINPKENFVEKGINNKENPKNININYIHFNISPNININKIISKNEAGPKSEKSKLVKNSFNQNNITNPDSINHSNILKKCENMEEYQKKLFMNYLSSEIANRKNNKIVKINKHIIAKSQNKSPIYKNSNLIPNEKSNTIMVDQKPNSNPKKIVRNYNQDNFRLDKKINKNGISKKNYTLNEIVLDFNPYLYNSNRKLTTTTATLCDYYMNQSKQSKSVEKNNNNAALYKNNINQYFRSRIAKLKPISYKNTNYFFDNNISNTITLNNNNSFTKDNNLRNMGSNILTIPEISSSNKHTNTHDNYGSNSKAFASNNKYLSFFTKKNVAEGNLNINAFNHSNMNNYKTKKPKATSIKKPILPLIKIENNSGKKIKQVNSNNSNNESKIISPLLYIKTESNNYEERTRGRGFPSYSGSGVNLNGLNANNNKDYFKYRILNDLRKYKVPVFTGISN